MASLNRKATLWGALAVVALGVGLAVALEAGNGSPKTTTPIRHVVIVYQENHSYDNVLGLWCARHPRRHCDGATSGKTSTGMLGICRTPKKISRRCANVFQMSRLLPFRLRSPKGWSN